MWLRQVLKNVACDQPVEGIGRLLRMARIHLDNADPFVGCIFGLKHIQKDIGIVRHHIGIEVMLDERVVHAASGSDF